MSSFSEPPQPVFRLSMLVNDTRYRGITFQIIAFLAIVLLFGWMAWNAAQNLAAPGRTFRSSFWAKPRAMTSTSN